MSTIVEFPDRSQLELTGILAESLAERLSQLSLKRETKIDEAAVAVRCVMNDRLYEVTFHHDTIGSVYTLHLGNRGGRIFEMRRNCAARFRRSLDPIIDAARGAHGQSAAEAAAITREAFILQLRERHGRLMRDAAKVQALIARLQRDPDLASPASASPGLVPEI